MGGNVGPPLDRDVLAASVPGRLAAGPYQENGQADRGPRAAAVENILRLDGTARARAWIAQHIQEPGFDDASSSMPDLGVAAGEALTTAAYLMPDRPLGQRIEEAIRSAVAPITPRKLGALLAAFMLGAMVGIFVFRVYVGDRGRSHQGPS